MRGFWALPAILRVAIASHRGFSVQEDVLAYPQYEFSFSHDYVTELQAQARLAHSQERIGGQDTDSEDTLGEFALQDPNLRSRPDRPSQDETQYKYEEMVLDSHRYLCSIPVVRKLERPDETNETLSRQDEEKELARANDRGWELLQGMSGNCIYFWSGWWSYRYCYGQSVKQFHQLPPSAGVPAYPPVEDPGVEGFILGSLEATVEEKGLEKGTTQSPDGTKALGRLETRGESRYLVQHLSGGTTCDLTGKKRRIEVQFHCNPASGDRISLIKEVSTCAYLMVIQTPRLCNDVAFLPPQKDSPNMISCSRIVNQMDLPSFEAQRAKEAAIRDLQDTTINPFKEMQSEALATVGSITVGAHKLISPDRPLEKSAIVGGGKGVYVETIADSMGKLLTPEQLSKKNLGDANKVEELKQELQKIANGQGWKLDVFDTPQGREYRGVVLNEDDSDSESTEEGNTKAGQHKDGDGNAHNEEQLQGSEETYKDEL